MSLDLRTRLICRNYPPPLLISNNPTDVNLEILGNPWQIPDDSFHYSGSWQRDTAKNAPRDKRDDSSGIELYDLVFILAKEESYNDILPKLWNYSGFNDGRSDNFPKWNDCISKNRQGRSWAWYWMLCRWTIFEKPKFKDIDSINVLESYYFHGLKKIMLLPLYNFENGMFKEIRETDEQSPEHFVKLSEFENYCKNIDEKIPLPRALYGSSADEQKMTFDADLNKKNSVLPCRPGTKWEDVKITLVADSVVRIETPSGNERYSYHDLGMADKRTRDLDSGMLWALLKQFAKNQGTISRDNSTYDPKLPDTAKRLNKHLQDKFAIKGSMFIDHYKSEKGYRTKIFFSDETTVV